MSEGRLDQGVAVDQGPVEIKDQPTRWAAPGERLGSKKRVGIRRHLCSTSLGSLDALPGELRCRKSTLPKSNNDSLITSPSRFPLRTSGPDEGRARTHVWRPRKKTQP